MTAPLPCHHCDACPERLGGYVCQCGAPVDLEMIRARELTNCLCLAGLREATLPREAVIGSLLRVFAGAESESLTLLRALEVARAAASLVPWDRARRAEWLAAVLESAAVFQAAQRKATTR